MQGHVEIKLERRRQKKIEGWTSKHDDAHKDKELLYAAYAYLTEVIYGAESIGKTLWPWDISWWKPKDDRKNLAKAGALIAAELDRLNRIK